MLAVTDFHLKEGTEIAKKFRKPVVRLRLGRDFLPALMDAARHGRLAMIVSDTVMSGTLVMKVTMLISPTTRSALFPTCIMPTLPPSTPAITLI